MSTGQAEFVFKNIQGISLERLLKVRMAAMPRSQADAEDLLCEVPR
jgi:hypothetical protein